MNEAREYRRKRLDDAIQEFILAAKDAEEVTENHFITGWVIGISLSGYDDGVEMDGFLAESSPGLNNFMACGLGIATQDAFTDQAINPGVD